MGSAVTLFFSKGKPAWRVLGVVLVLASALLAQTEDPDLTAFTLSRTQLDLLPGGGFLPAFFESYAPGATLLNDEGNGFSLLEAPRVYSAGESPDQFRWRVGGFAIDSALEAGTPTVRIPSLAASALRLSGNGLDWQLHPEKTTGHRFLLSTALPRLGGVWHWGRHLVPNLAGERGGVVASERRRFGGNGNLSWRWDPPGLGGASWRAAADLALQERWFNDPQHADRPYAERGALASLLLFRPPRPGTSAPELLLAAEWLSRDHLGAEWGRLPGETLSQQRQALVVGVGQEKATGGWRAVWQVEHEQRTPQQADLVKEVIDPDGEGIWPFCRWGSRTALSARFQGNLRRRLGVLHLTPRIELLLSPTWGSDGTYGDAPMFLAGQPWRAVRWQKGSDWRRLGLDGLLATSWDLALGGPWQASGDLLLRGQGLVSQSPLAPTPFFWTAGFTFALRHEGRRSRLLAEIGSQPETFPLSGADFLVTAAPSATIHDWNDSDHDRQLDAGEEGPVRWLSGGRFHGLAPGTALPRRERLMVGFRQRLSGVWDLGLHGMLRRERDGLWVMADNERGVTRPVEGVPVFFVTAPPDAFILGNRTFGRDPFYAQFLLDISASRSRLWQFRFSFMAHMGMAQTPFGNGPSADVRSIGEAMADPNARTFAFGRVDGDRAFVAKLHGTWQLGRALSVAGSMRYRDGTPFAFLAVARSENGQALYYQTIKGEDEHGKKGGPREDCLWDLSLAVHWRFFLAGRSCRLSLQGFNLLDWGSELAEDVFAGNLRRALELDMPRSLRLLLEVDL